MNTDLGETIYSENYYETFLKYIDEFASKDAEQIFETTTFDSFIDVINIQEKMRGQVIKNQISKTHSWTKCSCVDNKGFNTDIFWCMDCGVKCSIFDHISCLSIISKVKDNLPTYTTHNKYLMLTCQEIKALNAVSDELHCFECGTPSKGRTPDCHQIVGG